MGTLPERRRNVKSKSLADLGRRANEEHRAGNDCVAGGLRAGLDHYLEAGRYLAEAKTQVAHGQWTTWLREHFEGSVRTAQAYMRLHRNRDRIEAKAQGLALLGVEGALKLLAEPAGDGQDADPNDAHAAALNGAQAALDHALEAGRLLAEAKDHLAHGEWAEWLDANFEGSPAAAEHAISLHERQDTLRPERMSVAEILELLAPLADGAEPAA